MCFFQGRGAKLTHLLYQGLGSLSPLEYSISEKQLVSTLSVKVGVLRRTGALITLLHSNLLSARLVSYIFHEKSCHVSSPKWLLNFIEPDVSKVPLSIIAFSFISLDTFPHGMNHVTLHDILCLP